MLFRLAPVLPVSVLFCLPGGCNLTCKTVCACVQDLASKHAMQPPSASGLALAAQGNTTAAEVPATAAEVPAIAAEVPATDAEVLATAADFATVLAEVAAKAAVASAQTAAVFQVTEEHAEPVPEQSPSSHVTHMPEQAPSPGVSHVPEQAPVAHVTQVLETASLPHMTHKPEQAPLPYATYPPLPYATYTPLPYAIYQPRTAEQAPILGMTARNLHHCEEEAWVDDWEEEVWEAELAMCQASQAPPGEHLPTAHTSQTLSTHAILWL